MVISLTFLIQGGMTESLLRYLNVPCGVEYAKKKSKGSEVEDDLYVHGEGGFPGWMNVLLAVNRQYLLPSLTIPLKGKEGDHSMREDGGGNPLPGGRRGEEEEESSGSDDGLIMKDNEIGTDLGRGHDPSEIDISIHDDIEGGEQTQEQGQSIDSSKGVGGQEEKGKSDSTKYDDI